MRKPCCDKQDTNKGAWSKQEDQKLIDYIKKNGEGRWRTLPQAAGLLRCGKSCRLRWINYLRPDLKRGNFAEDEEDLIIKLHALLGNRWSLIAGRLPGRTDNEVKNYWNSHLRRKLINIGIDPNNHKIIRHSSLNNPSQSRALARHDGSKSATTSSNLNKQGNKHMPEDQPQHLVLHCSSTTKPNATSGNIILSNVDDGQAISDAASSLGEAPSSSSMPDLNLDLMISTPSNHHAGNTSNHTSATSDDNHQRRHSETGTTCLQGLAENGDKTLILFM